MSKRVEVLFAAGKTVEKLEKNLTPEGGTFSDLFILHFTDGTTIELTPQKLHDGRLAIKMDVYDKEPS